MLLCCTVCSTHKRSINECSSFFLQWSLWRCRSLLCQRPRRGSWPNSSSWIVRNFRGSSEAEQYIDVLVDSETLDAALWLCIGVDLLQVFHLVGTAYRWAGWSLLQCLGWEWPFINENSEPNRPWFACWKKLKIFLKSENCRWSERYTECYVPAVNGTPNGTSFLSHQSPLKGERVPIN